MVAIANLRTGSPREASILNGFMLNGHNQWVITGGID